MRFRRPPPLCLRTGILSTNGASKDAEKVIKGYLCLEGGIRGSKAWAGIMATRGVLLTVIFSAHSLQGDRQYSTNLTHQPQDSWSQAPHPHPSLPQFLASEGGQR